MINQEQVSQQVLEQRRQRFKQMGINPVSQINENVNGTVHSHAVRQKYGDILSGKKRGVIQKLMSSESKTGPQSYSDIPVPKPKNGPKVKPENIVKVADFGSKVNASHSSEIDRLANMWDPDRGMSPQPSSYNGQSGGVTHQLDISNYGPSMTPTDYAEILRKKYSQGQQGQTQQPLTSGQQAQPNPQTNNTLSYSQFASNKEAFTPKVNETIQSPEAFSDYQANQSYMHAMNEQMIREIAEEIAAETVKSVLAEFIKKERKKYAFERVWSVKNGKKRELLRKDGKYYELSPISKNKETYLALKEIKVSKSKA